MGILLGPDQIPASDQPCPECTIADKLGINLEVVRAAKMDDLTWQFEKAVNFDRFKKPWLIPVVMAAWAANGKLINSPDQWVGFIAAGVGLLMAGLVLFSEHTRTAGLKNTIVGQAAENLKQAQFVSQCEAYNNQPRL